MVLKLNRSHARDFGLGTSVVGVEVLHVVVSDLGLGKVRLTLSSNRGSYLPKLPNLQFSIMLTCRRSDSDTRLTLAHGNNDPNFVCLSLFKTSSGTSEISHCETRGPDPDRNKRIWTKSQTRSESVQGMWKSLSFRASGCPFDGSDLIFLLARVAAVRAEH